MAEYKILLVDDEEELVTTMVERLEFRGLAAAAATSGADALSQLRRERFDVVVIDLKMPGMDGLSLRDLIAVEFPGILVLMATGHGSDAASAAALPEGGEEVLLKPFSIEVLIDLIERKRRGGGGAP
ncbi:response regulator [bacterium]|nr:response regulator [bacterium]MBU1675671.1 response regulator [bacterium]